MTNTGLNEKNASLPNTDDADTDIPIDISDIIKVCKNYAILGVNIQQQIECIIDLGIDEAVDSGKVKIEVLPHIREFLKSITDHFLGDAVDQSFAVIMMIDDFEAKNQGFSLKQAN